MVKSFVFSLITFVMAMCVTSYADTFVTMNTWEENNYEHCSLQGIDTSNGAVLWNQYLGAAAATELELGQYLGMNNGLAYALFNGTVYVLDPLTGAIILANPDFGGASATWTFSSSGKLYMCGWYGPDLFIMDSNGTTLSRVESLSKDYFWPDYIYFTTGNILRINYDGPEDFNNNKFIEIDVTRFFGIIQK